MNKIVLVLILICSVNLFSQNDEEEVNIDTPKSDIKKALYGELGYGWNGMGAAAGLRFWHFGISMGLNGFANGIPNYAQYIPNLNLSLTEPLPNGYISEKYVGVIVSGDFSFFLDDFAAFDISASVGFYSEADTILAKNVQTNDRVRWKTEVSDGITFGLAFDYPYNKDYSVGLVAHTKRGIAIRLSYIWY